MTSANEAFGVREDATAAELGAALEAAVADDVRLRKEVERLASERRAGLLSGATDDVIDRIEAELQRASRGIERHEQRIPMLKQLHLERVAEEQQIDLEATFKARVNVRLEAAKAVDQALMQLGATFRVFEEAGRSLDSIRGFHGRAPWTSSDENRLHSTLRAVAPEFATAAGIRGHGWHARASSVAAEERRRWNLDGSRGVAVRTPEIDEKAEIG